MKHLLLLALLLGLALAASAQSANPAVWCPAGATWTYAYGRFTVEGTLTVRYVRDTLVAGQPAQLLTQRLRDYDRNFPGAMSTSALPSVVTRTVADRVEVLANGQFYTLYDFGVQPGGSWVTPSATPAGPCPAEVVRVTVDSVGTQLVAGRPLRWFRASVTRPAGAAAGTYRTGRIYEQVGDLGYMQPQSPICAGTDPGALGPFMSYRAAGWPAINNPAAGVLLATAQARATASGFSVFPNPGTGMVTLHLPPTLAPAATLHLLDPVGRLVRQGSVPAGRQLDVRGLPAGSYTLLLSSPGQPPLAQRLVLY